MGVMELDPELAVIAREATDRMALGQMTPPRIPWEFEQRREAELTAEYLGRVLEWVGVPELAANARLGHYDDYFAPAEVADGLESLRLIRDLRRAAAAAEPGIADRARQVENAVMFGEFDATKAESDRWAASKNGQDVFRQLLKTGRNEPCWCGSGKKFKKCHGK